MFHPERLDQAMKQQGYRISELAAETGVSRNTLSKYLNTDPAKPMAEPNQELLAKLAAVLGVTPNYFESSQYVELPATAISFRKLTKAKATEKHAALATAKTIVEFYQLLEQYFNLPEPNIPTFDAATDPEHAAQLVRDAWLIGDHEIPDLVTLLEVNGARIANLPPGLENIDACSFYYESKPYIIVDSAKSRERIRFDLAHELGHLVLHHAENSGEIPEHTKELEAQANRFASAFLMAKTRLNNQGLKNANISTLLDAKKFWQVSAMAMARRLYDLNLISEWTYKTHIQHLASRGYRSSEPDSELAPEHSAILSQTLLGENRISLQTITTQMGYQTPATIAAMLRSLVKILPV